MLRDPGRKFGIGLETGTVAVKNITRTIRIVVEAVDPVDPMTNGLKVRLTVSTGDPPKLAESAFRVGLFDFPMIDNARISEDQRCAIILNDFDKSTAAISVICFPGSLASLKERPFYDDVVQNLRTTSETLGSNVAKPNR